MMLKVGEDAENALPNTKSGYGETSFNFVVRNNSDADLDAFWLSYDGEEMQYFTVPAGGEQTQQTYVTHPWAFKTADGELACLFKARYELRKPNTVLTFVISDHFSAEPDLGDFRIRCVKDTRQDKGEAIDEEVEDEPEEEETLVEAPDVDVEETGNQEAIDFVNSVIEAGEPWTDPDFPPCIQSFRKDEEAHKAPGHFGDTWKRAPEIQKNLGVFKEGPSFDDIAQGGVGDCYFLAALASVGEFPELIKARFITKKINKAGIYAVSLFINGREKVVMVDDHFMVDQWNRPHFAKFSHGKIWVAILEKVWAKLLGSIWRMNYGYVTDAT